MRSLLVLAAVVSCVVPAAFAANKTYEGNSSYSTPWNDVRPSFSDLEQLGVEKAAEQDAVQKCAAAGNSVCYIVASSITYCNEEVNGPNEIDCAGRATALAPNP
jgi:hypothetical protein